jgi:DNA-binding CsgD family transcriptional regulator
MSAFHIERVEFFSTAQPGLKDLAETDRELAERWGVTRGLYLQLTPAWAENPGTLLVAGSPPTRPLARRIIACPGIAQWPPFTYGMAATEPRLAFTLPDLDGEIAADVLGPWWPMETVCFPVAPLRGRRGLFVEHMGQGIAPERVEGYHKDLRDFHARLCLRLDEGGPAPRLSRQLRSYLFYAKLGLYNKEIAHRMGVSVKSVEGYLPKARDALGVPNLALAMTKATDLGLIA